MKPGDLYRAIGVPASTGRRARAELEREGLVACSKAAIRLASRAHVPDPPPHVATDASAFGGFRRESGRIVYHFQDEEESDEHEPDEHEPDEPEPDFVDRWLARQASPPAAASPALTPQQTAMLVGAIQQRLAEQSAQRAAEQAREHEQQLAAADRERVRSLKAAERRTGRRRPRRSAPTTMQDVLRAAAEQQW